MAARPRAARERGERRAVARDDVAPITFGPPVSPHYAAELAGTTVEPLELAAAARAAGEGADALVCEGVGGLMVPLTPGYLIRDLALDLDLPLIVAARPGSARSTTRCSRSRPRAPRDSRWPPW